MKNTLSLIFVVISFVAGIFVIPLLPNDVSLQIQQIFNIDQVNAPPLEAFGTSSITNIQVSPSNNVILTQSDYFVKFTTPNDATPVRTIEITFPSGFILTKANYQNFQYGYNYTISGQKLILTISNGDEPFSNEVIYLRFGGIVNPSTLNNQVSIDMKNSAGTMIFGPNLSPVFTLTGIKSYMINNGAVVNTKIANGAITNSKISNNSVNSTQIQNGAFTDSSIIMFIGQSNGCNPFWFGSMEALCNSSNISDGIHGAEIPVPFNGTLSNFYINHESPINATNTLYVNNAKSVLTCTEIGTNSCHDAIHTVKVNAGDSLVVLKNNTGTNGDNHMTATVMITRHVP